MSKRLLPAKTVCERLGGISAMTLWRYLQDETINFPKPTIIRKRRYWDADEIEAFVTRHAVAAVGKRAA